LKKLLALIAFSVLLLVPVGAQQVFANHPNLPCLPPGILITGPDVLQSSSFGETYCFGGFPDVLLRCPPVYILDIFINTFIKICTTDVGSFPDPTLAAQCQGAAVLLSNHCFAEAMASMVGGILLSIDTTGVLVAAIGTDPVVTGLVAITMAGISGQAAWFIHRRRKKNSLKIG